MALAVLLLIAFTLLSTTYGSREVDYFGTPGPVVDVDATKLPKSTHVDTLHPTCRGANGILFDSNLSLMVFSVGK